ncbi:hypothetical protein Syun_014437 [Stephania yunnanensis]|uniref:Uncharacterized protein n=1 Tax=Stephania yunnanensis TaxID=152371 RepID=A0AAP0JLN5_9MAGN
MEPETWRNKAVYDVAALGDMAVSHWPLELYLADVALVHNYNDYGGKAQYVQ